MGVARLLVDPVRAPENTMLERLASLTASVSFGLATLLVAAAGCSSAPAGGEVTGRTEQAACVESYDWHDFPGGLQCVGGVDGFFQAHFGVGLPALCQYPTQNGCQSCGACEFWEANAPDPKVWDRLPSGPAQLFDMAVFPPVSGNAYGHVGAVDHVDAQGNVYVMDDNYVAYQTKASCPHTVSWAPYGYYRLKSLEDKPPQGWLDSADCTQIVGWSYDPDTATQPIDVDVYLGGAAGSGAPGIHLLANGNRPDLCTAIGSCDHGYVVPTPLGLMDGAAHAVYPYGIDSSGNGDNPLLQGAPKSFTCPPPAIPYSPAIKRHVTDTTVYGAWAFDALTDVAHLADATLNPVPAGPDIPAAPRLVTPDDGSAGVYLVDGAVVRHVQDPNSMTAWHFAWSAIAKMPAAEFHAMAQGLAWPETPFLAQGTGPAVYMIDLTTPPQEADAGGADGGATKGGGADGGAGASNEGGLAVGDAGGSAAGDASWETNQGASSSGSSGGCSAAGSRDRGPWGMAALALLVSVASACRRRAHAAPMPRTRRSIAPSRAPG